MARNTKYKMQAIDIPIIKSELLPGINVPQINYGTAIGGADRPENNATKGADWLSNLTNIPADLFQNLINTLDDIADGTTYGKVLSTDISDGHILLTSVEGNLDNITDGVTYGKILLTGISAGKIVLAEVDGNLDDISEGATYGKVALTNISAGNIILQTDQNLSEQGIKIITANTGARVELLPDANTGIAIIDDGGADVFKAIIGGADIGDVIIGNYAGGQGLKYDKSAGKILYKNIAWSEVVDDNGSAPADNATVGAIAGTDLIDEEDDVLVGTRIKNDFQAGTDLLAYADTEGSVATLSYEVKKEILISNNKGVLTIKFSIASGNGVAVYGKLYKNSTAVGTERSTTSGHPTYVEYTENISVEAGDVIQLYVHGTLGNVVWYKNFRVYYKNLNSTTVNIN
jgi:hypothetical protein